MPRAPSATAALGLAGAALAATIAVVTYDGNDPGSLGAALARAGLVLLPLAVGQVLWTRLPDRRFGPLLVAAGLLTFVAALSGSGGAVVYSAGRVATWAVELALVYLALAFPTGRLRRREDRWLVGATALVLAVLYLPTALLADGYPTPSTWASCVHACPGNAFQVAAHEPAWVGGVVLPLRELLVSILFVLLTLRLVVRIRRATVPMRRTLTPVLAAAIVHTVALPVAFAARRAGDPQLTQVLMWLLAAGLAMLTVGFLVGATRWRLAIGEGLYRLAGMLHGRLDPAALRRALADTLQDPTTDLFYRATGGEWLDAGGRTVELPAPASGRAATLVHDGDVVVAAIVHDEALADQQAFVDAVAGLALVVLTNQRLAAQVEASLREVRRSRGRILAAADEERRRIERDLHDGAQQRLVALQIKLELASELSAAQHLPDADQLHRLSEDVGDALDDVRSLAAGVYPALLVDCGLEEALRSVARRSPLPVEVDASGVGRYPPQIEAAVYFSCLEALQNAAKHAHAELVSVSVTNGNGLSFEVRDDGQGFDRDAGAGGHGLTNISDRLGAVGGTLTAESHPGGGTRIAGTIPHALPRREPSGAPGSVGQPEPA